MKINKAIITAAGFGSRFLPITKTIPKEMLPIIDKPIIHWIVEECAQAGMQEIIIVAAPDEVKMFEDYFYGHAEVIKRLMYRQGKIDRWKKVESIFNLPLITVIPEDRTIPYGNGRPVLTAKDLVKEEEAFVICFGDDLVLSKVSAVKQLVDYFQIHTPTVLLGVQEATDEMIPKGGIIKIKTGTDNAVERVIEKPKLEDAPSRFLSYGRFVVTPQIFEYLHAGLVGKDGEVWLQDANDQLAQHHKALFRVIDGTWLTTGDPHNYMIAQNKFFEQYSQI